MACIAYEEMAPRQCATRGVGGVGEGTGARAFNRQGVVSGDESHSESVRGIYESLNSNSSSRFHHAHGEW